MNSADKIIQTVCDDLNIRAYADMPIFSEPPEFDFIVYQIKEIGDNYATNEPTEIISDITIDYFTLNSDNKIEDLIEKLSEKEFVFGSKDKQSKELAEPCKFRYTLNFIYI